MPQKKKTEPEVKQEVPAVEEKPQGERPVMNLSAEEFVLLNNIMRNYRAIISDEIRTLATPEGDFAKVAELSQHLVGVNALLDKVSYFILVLTGRQNENVHPQADAQQTDEETLHRMQNEMARNAYIQPLEAGHEDKAVQEKPVEAEGSAQEIPLQK